MAEGILGRKIGMTHVFTDSGQWVPVTVIEAGPCPVVQKKDLEKDGYLAVQLGFGAIKERRVNRPLKGHFARAGVAPRRFLREFRLTPEEAARYQVGQEVRVDLFSPGEKVDVTGTSKGKGFAGVIKRWGFRRGPMSHGSMYHRRTGALGATDPQRVFKGRKLPGRLGGEQRTVRGLQVVRVDTGRNLLLVRGAVPGPNGGLLVVRRSNLPGAGRAGR